MVGMFAAIIAAPNRLRLLLLLVLTMMIAPPRGGPEQPAPATDEEAMRSGQLPRPRRGMSESSRSGSFPGYEISFTDREYFGGPSAQNRSLPSADQRGPAFADSGRTSRLQGLRAAKDS